MPHVRKLIRDAVATLLTGLPTTGSRVYVGRTRPLPAKHEPSLLIYTTEEVSARPMEGNPADVGRDLQLLVDGRVRTACRPTICSTRSRTRSRASCATTSSTAWLFDIQLVRTVSDVKADGEQHIGGIRMEFRVRYWDPDEEEE